MYLEKEKKVENKTGNKHKGHANISHLVIRGPHYLKNIEASVMKTLWLPLKNPFAVSITMSGDEHFAFK